MNREALALLDANESSATRAHKPFTACAGTAHIQFVLALGLQGFEDALGASLKAHEALNGAESACALWNGGDGEGDGAGVWNRAHAGSL